MYHVAKSTSFLTPIAIWTAPAILASSTTAAAAGAAEKSTSLILMFAELLVDSRARRYATMSDAERKSVELDELARRAKGIDWAFVDVRDVSSTVRTRGYVEGVIASGDTEPHNQLVISCR